MVIEYIGKETDYDQSKFKIIGYKTCKDCKHSEKPSGRTDAKIKCKYKLSQIKYDCLISYEEIIDNIEGIVLFEKDIGWNCKSFEKK